MKIYNHFRQQYFLHIWPLPVVNLYSKNHTKPQIFSFKINSFCHKIYQILKIQCWKSSKKRNVYKNILIYLKVLSNIFRTFRGSWNILKCFDNYEINQMFRNANQESQFSIFKLHSHNNLLYKIQKYFTKL